MAKKIVNINEQELRTLIRKKILEQSAISNQVFTHTDHRSLFIFH